ncbi:hypothetical protein NDU88_005198 [Pleurodeles waltl]|uniref:Uncharacterized protein n=1 Tax=Pleurodeles waltl TaxID=8319 RepID=A0AAV7QH61_PLEWA|nr:hypothetical protein NDU88_005198 [Pleurodeles waltl]
MPSEKPGSKPTGKPARHLLFMEALLQAHPVAATKGLSMSGWADNPAGLKQDSTMDHIIQKIMAVGGRLEGMDSNISVLTAETKSICIDIVGFQNHVMDQVPHILVVEDRLNTLPERDQGLLFLRSKVIDRKDRSRSDNVRFFCFQEHAEGSDIKRIFKEYPPTLTGLTFEPPLELQMTHLLGPLLQGGSSCPHPIIACFLRHEQAR